MKTRSLVCAAALALAGMAHAAPRNPEYERCVAHPQAPGFHWSPAVIEAFCADYLIEAIEYDEVKRLLDQGQGKRLDARFAQVMADYDAGRVAEGTARNAFMENFNWCGE